MIYVYKDRIINVEWTVLKGTSTVKENFDRALVKLFLIGPHEKFLLKANAKDGIVSAEVPQGLPEGVYSVEIIYIKNWLGVDRPPKMPDRFPIDCRGNDRCIMRSRKDNLFAITEYESEATEIGEGEVVIRVKTSTASYGYDGLSAYEIAVLRGDFEGTEGEWLEWTHERIVTDVKDLLDKLKSRDTRFVVKTQSQRDNLKDLREGDEVYVIDDGIAYILETENGKRTWKPCDYGTVTSKYILSLIAGMPGFVADRAIADEFGKRIVDEYLTRDAVRNYMNEVFNDLFVNNPPTIMDGMITVDMLSDAVKQLIGFGPIVNFPDDEFLTTKGGRITPKDRNYDPNNYSGMGRKILRKNMVNGVNVLTQKMMSCPNTVYVITYDYSLRGQTITVPENCVLRFEGGTITNGVIKATNVINTYFKPEWFGAKGDNFTDDSAAFQMVSNLCNSCNCKTIRLSEATYLIDNITIYSYMSIIGEDKYKSVLKSYSNPLNLPILISDDTQGHNISLRNLTVESSGERTEYTVKILNKIGTIVDNCYFVRNEVIGEPNDYHGIFIGRKEGAEIVYITKFTNNRVNQCCVTIEGTDGYIDHNELWGIGCKSALHLIKSGNHMISANQIVGGSVNGAMYLTEWATSLKIFGNYFDGGSTTVANVPYGLNADTELIYSTITNNNFWLLDGAGIRAKSSIGNVINGNVFENNDRADNGTSDIILENTMSGSISNNSFVRAKVSRVNKSPILNITGYVGSDYEPIIINGNVVRGYRNYSASIYIPKDSTIKTVNNNSKLFEYSSNASPYRLFNPYGELNYNSGETIKSSPLDARVFTYIETDRKVRLDNLTYVDSTTLPESKKFDFNIIYNKDFNLYINNYNSVLNPPVWVTGNMWLENRYLSTGYCRQIIYSSNGNVLYSRISANSIWSEWVNADNTLTSKVKVPLDIFSFVYSDIVYKITNDIDLNGATLTLPSGCTLDFQGGSFSNGTIVGNGTKIIAGLTKIFGTDITLNGTWNCSDIYDSWFTQSEDSFALLQNLCNLTSDNYYGTIYINGNHDVVIPDNALSIKPNSRTTIILEGSITVAPNNFTNYYIFRLIDKNSITIKGGGFLIGDVETHTGTTGEWGHGIFIQGCYNININNLQLKNFWGDGIEVDKSSSNLYTSELYLSNLTIYNNRRQGISLLSVKNVFIDNCVIYGIGSINGTNPKGAIDIEPEGDDIAENIFISNCIEYSNGLGVSAHNTIKNITVDNCTFLSAQGIWHTGDIIFKNCSFGRFFNLEGDIIKFINCDMPITNIISSNLVEIDNCRFRSKASFDTVSDKTSLLCFNYSDAGINKTCKVKVRNSSFDNTKEGTSSIPLVRKALTKNMGDKDVVFENCSFRNTLSYLYGCIQYGDYYNCLFEVPSLALQLYADKAIKIVGSTIVKNDNAADRAILTIESITKNFTEDSIVLFLTGNTFQYSGVSIIDIPATNTNDKKVSFLNNLFSTRYISEESTLYINLKNKFDTFYYSNSRLDYQRYIGNTSNRGTPSINNAGITYFDTDLNKLILWNGTAWTNLDGTSLS